MPQISKVIQSRDEWKEKAVQRANELREFRKTKKRHLTAIAELKSQMSMLEQVNEDKKNSSIT